MKIIQLSSKELITLLVMVELSLESKHNLVVEYSDNIHLLKQFTDELKLLKLIHSKLKVSQFNF